MRSLDDTDRLLLTVIQREFPLLPRPYILLGRELGIPEGEALRRTNSLRDAGPIRQISAIFNTRSLGYRSTLAAFRIPPDRLETAAKIVSAHPGVSHNYERVHDYNLWFTIAVPPTSHLGLEKTVEVLAREAGASSTLLLPTIKTFKIGVKLDMTDNQGSEPAREGGAGTASRDKSASASPFPLGPETWPLPTGPDGVPLPNAVDDLAGDEDFPPLDPHASMPLPLTQEQVELVRRLQEDIPRELEPFKPGAEAAGLAVDDYLREAAAFMRSRHMRRFAAVLHHREAGFVANAMGVWAVPQDKVDEIGAAMASFRAVSHCYQRPTCPGWPYSLFTMVHAKSREECEQILGAIAEATGVADRGVLYSVKDFKKVRVRYFTPEIEEWEKPRLS